MKGREETGGEHGEDKAGPCLHFRERLRGDGKRDILSGVCTEGGVLLAYFWVRSTDWF